MAVPSTAKHSASAICVFLFIRCFSLSAEPVSKTLFMTNLLLGGQFQSGSPATNKESRGWRLQPLGRKAYNSCANPAEMQNCPQCGAELGSDESRGTVPEVSDPRRAWEFRYR